MDALTNTMLPISRQCPVARRGERQRLVTVQLVTGNHRWPANPSDELFVFGQPHAFRCQVSTSTSVDLRRLGTYKRTCECRPPATGHHVTSRLWSRSRGSALRGAEGRQWCVGVRGDVDAGARRGGSQRAHPTIARRYRLAAVAGQVASGRLDHSNPIRLSSLRARVARRPWQRPQPDIPGARALHARYAIGGERARHRLGVRLHRAGQPAAEHDPHARRGARWRGFLVPELTTWVGFRRASLCSGVIWGAWHLPGILTGACNVRHTEGTSSCASRSW